MLFIALQARSKRVAMLPNSIRASYIRHQFIIFCWRPGKRVWRDEPDPQFNRRSSP